MPEESPDGSGSGLIRLCWQSFVDEQSSGDYLALLQSRVQARANAAAAAGCRVEVTVRGMSPPARDWGRVSELRGGVVAVRNAMQAAEDGYDLFVIGHFQEPCLAEARAAVDIPVVGLGESTMLWSAHLGRRFGLVSVDDVFEVIHLEQAERLGMTDRLVGVRALNATLDEFRRAFAGEPGAYQVLKDRFQVAAAELVEQGADVVISAGGLFGTLSLDDQDVMLDGTPLVNCVAVGVDWAVMTERLQRSSGLRPNRRGAYRLANEQARQDYRQVLADS
ncbi:MAG: aspartate/glutamate racemase family protein [Actinomycetales bacterium]